MEPTRWVLALVLVSTTAAGATAQRAAAVQLPTYSYFTTSTTVSVPDRGGALLGGVNRAASGSQSFGGPLSPFPQRGSGGDRGAAGLGITAMVHDFEAMEAHVLNQSASQRGPVSKADPWEDRLKDAARSSAGRPVPSVADLQATQIEAGKSAGRDAADWYARGRQAEADGNEGAAKVYFGMAARRAEGPAREEILARLDGLSRAVADRRNQGKR